MAGLFRSGFETQWLTATVAEAGPDGIAAGTNVPTIDTTNQRSGLACAACGSNGTTTSYVYWTFTAPSAGTAVYVRAYGRLSALPTSATVVSRIGTGAHVSVRLTSGGLLQLWNDVASTQIGSSSGLVLETGMYYRIELMLTIGTGATDSATLRVFDAQEGTVETVATTSSASITDTQPTEAQVGVVTAPGTTLTLYLDDVAGQDSTGTTLNSWPNEGHIVELKPYRTAVESTWLTCTNSADRFLRAEAIRSVPPASHIDLTSHSTPHQIRTTSTAGLQFGTRAPGEAGVIGDVNTFEGAEALTDTIVTFGETTNEQVTGKLSFTGTIERLRVRLYKNAAPTDTLICDICTDDGAGNPGTVVLSSDPLDGTTLGTSPPAFTTNFPIFTFPQTPLSGFYWLVLRRTAAVNGTDYYRVYCPTTSLLSHHNMPGVKQLRTGVWTVPTNGNAMWIPTIVNTAQGDSNINAAWAVCAHGEGVASQTKAGSLALGHDTNSEIADTATFNFGDDVGAAGTFPTNWRWKRTAFEVPNKAVNKGLGFRITLARTSSGTTIGLFGYASVMIDYASPIPGWRQVTKTSDSSLHWVKQVSVAVYGYTDAGTEVECVAGDWFLAPDGSGEPDTSTTLTTITTETLQANYTGW
jgi:hypothetical protein